MKKKKKDGFILLVAVFLIALAFGAAYLMQNGKTPTGMVRIYVNGQIHTEAMLGQERDIEISQPDGKKNILHLTNNGFFMASSTCTNQLCIQQGEVTAENYYLRALGARVVCLPNEVQAELVLLDRTAPPDAPDI